MAKSFQTIYNRRKSKIVRKGRKRKSNYIFQDELGEIKIGQKGEFCIK